MFGKSTVERFPQKVDPLPGPGAYELPAMAPLPSASKKSFYDSETIRFPSSPQEQPPLTSPRHDREREILSPHIMKLLKSSNKKHNNNGNNSQKSSRRNSLSRKRIRSLWGNNEQPANTSVSLPVQLSQLLSHRDTLSSILLKKNEQTMLLEKMIQSLMRQVKLYENRKKNLSFNNITLNNSLDNTNTNMNTINNTSLLLGGSPAIHNHLHNLSESVNMQDFDLKDMSFLQDISMVANENNEMKKEWENFKKHQEMENDKENFLSTENKQLKSDVENMKTEMNALMEQIKKKELEINNEKEKFATLQTYYENDVSSRSSQSKMNDETLMSLENDKKLLEQEIKSLHDKVRELHSTVTNLQFELDEVRTIKDAEIENFRSEIENYKQQILNYQTNLLDTDALQLLNTELEQLRTSLSSAQSHGVTLQEKLTSANKELSSLRGELCYYHQESREMRDRCEELEEKIVEMKKEEMREKQEKETTISNQNIQIMTLKMNMKQMSYESELLQQESANEINNLKAANKELELKIQEHNTQLQTLEKKYEEQNEKIYEAEEHELEIYEEFEIRENEFYKEIESLKLQIRTLEEEKHENLVEMETLTRSLGIAEVQHRATVATMFGQNELVKKQYESTLETIASLKRNQLDLRNMCMKMKEILIDSTKSEKEKKKEQKLKKSQKDQPINLQMFLLQLDELMNENSNVTQTIQKQQQENLQALVSAPTLPSSGSGTAPSSTNNSPARLINSQLNMLQNKYNDAMAEIEKLKQQMATQQQQQAAPSIVADESVVTPAKPVSGTQTLSRASFGSPSASPFNLPAFHPDDSENNANNMMNDFNNDKCDDVTPSKSSNLTKLYSPAQFQSPMEKRNQLRRECEEERIPLKQIA